MASLVGLRCGSTTGETLPGADLGTVDGASTDATVPDAVSDTETVGQDTGSPGDADAVAPTDTSTDAGQPLEIPADRPILGYMGTTATDRDESLLPVGFSGPSETACAEDTTRVYIAEMFTHGINDVQVDYHWAPVVPGPALKPENPPVVDAYTALAPQPDADADAPTAIIEGADDQPFPFYGRVRAAWK